MTKGSGLFTDCSAAGPKTSYSNGVKTDRLPKQLFALVRTDSLRNHVIRVPGKYVKAAPSRSNPSSHSLKGNLLSRARLKRTTGRFVERGHIQVSRDTH